MTGADAVFVAPVCSQADARRILAAGAREVYCGFLPPDWESRYGDGETLSRRQGRQAHVASLDELAAIVRICQSAGAAAALTLNSRHGSGAAPEILRLAGWWEEAGGTAVMVADPALLLALHKRGSRLRRHVSVLASVFNSQSASFFAALGASRIVLPRELSIEEMQALIAGAPDLEYEALVFYQKCPFIDGMCGFYHGVCLPSGRPAEFEYQRPPDGSQPVVWSSDPAYEGHGCQLPWRTPQSPVAIGTGGDFPAPWCAACHLRALEAAGVRYLKLAGRGYPIEALEQGLRFLGEAARNGSPAAIRQLYRDRFQADCRGRRCYYATLA
jgi:U32 family peptidase